MTKTDDRKNPNLSARNRAITLLASCTDLIVRDARERPDLEILIRALQGFKDKTLGHVFVRSSEIPDLTTRYRLFSELFQDITFLSPKIHNYLARRGIRYVGEVYYVHFDRRSKIAQQTKVELFDALQTYLGLPREFNPLQDSWVPPYWSIQNFCEALSSPVIEILGDRTDNRGWGLEAVGYNSPARRIHRDGTHYVGQWLTNLREKPEHRHGSPVNGWSVGSLEDLQIQLSHTRALWAAALIPPDWKVPEGVPEIWTRLKQDVILPTIEHELERKRRGHEQWERELDKRRLKQEMWELEREQRLAMQPTLCVKGDNAVAQNVKNLRKRVDELELSIRATNNLQSADIEYVWQLCQYTEDELLLTRNFGHKVLNEIKKVLTELGLELGLVFSEDTLKLLRQRG